MEPVLDTFEPDAQVDVLCFGAHPDDVEMAMGGTVASLAADGARVGIVDLTQGERDGRRFYEQITLFKNCGSAIEDLVAARLAYQRT